MENMDLPAEGRNVEDPGTVPEPGEDQKTEHRPEKMSAREKLEKELEGAKDKSFAGPVIRHLLKRCEEDAGLAEDVAQEHKTWDKCFRHIFSRAQEQAKGERSAFVLDDVVYEWAEDYYRKDDKEEEEKKAREEAERKKREAARRKKAAEDLKARKKREAARKKKTAEDSQPASQKAETCVEKLGEEKEQKSRMKPKKNSKDMEGQIDLFSMMGM